MQSLEYRRQKRLEYLHRVMDKPSHSDWIYVHDAMPPDYTVVETWCLVEKPSGWENIFGKRLMFIPGEGRWCTVTARWTDDNVVYWRYTDD